MISVCLIGVSGYARVHYHQLTRLHQAGRIRLVGATIINQAEEQEACTALNGIGCQLFDDYQDMLQAFSGVAGLCCIPTGIPLHRPMTVAALEAGMHVFVEKPVSGSIEDLEAMQQAAAKADRQVMVGYQQLYDPVALELKRACLKGDIGTVEAVKCMVSWPRDTQYYARNGWAGKLKTGDAWVLDSPMNNAVAHDLMMSLFLAGETESAAARPVNVDAELYRAHDIDSTDTLCLKVQTPSGVPVLFYATHASDVSMGPVCIVRGTKGFIRWSHQEAVIVGEDGTEKALTKITDGLRNQMFDSVINRLEGADSFVCSLDLAGSQTRVITAAHQVAAIRTVPCQVTEKENGALLKMIPGILDTIKQAFEAEILFSDTHAPWTQLED